MRALNVLQSKCLLPVYEQQLLPNNCVIMWVRKHVFGGRHGHGKGIEKGRQEGIEKGRQEGLEEGIQEGMKKKEIEAVLGAFKVGVSPENISKALNISLERVQEILTNHP